MIGWLSFSISDGLAVCGGFEASTNAVSAASPTSRRMTAWRPLIGMMVVADAKGSVDELIDRLHDHVVWAYAKV